MTPELFIICILSLGGLAHTVSIWMLSARIRAVQKEIMLVRTRVDILEQSAATTAHTHHFHVR